MQADRDIKSSIVYIFSIKFTGSIDCSAKFTVRYNAKLILLIQIIVGLHIKQEWPYYICTLLIA